MGVALALLLLAGSAVVAGQAILERDDQRPAQPAPSATPAALPAAPLLATATDSPTKAATADVAVTLVERPPDARRHRLRIYVNEQLVLERRLPRDSSTVLTEIALEQGENRISAAVAGPGGESLHAPPLLIVRDDVAPRIHLSAPPDGEPVFTEELVVRGRTEPGATLRIGLAGSSQELRVRDDGRFSVPLSLAMGDNVITLRTEDAAGNRSATTLRVTRAETTASVSLTATPDAIELRQLPARITLLARITGPGGEAVHGATVNFSISVPGQPTSTYQTTSSHGVAAWRGFRVASEGALRGEAVATVMVVLATGDMDEMVLHGSAVIRFR